MTLTIDVPDGLRAQVLNQFETISEPGRLTVQIGDLVSGQELSIVVRLWFPNAQEGTRIEAGFSVQSASAHVAGPSARSVWTFASPMACKAQPRNQAVEEAIGEVYARARADAVELNRSGDFAGAKSVLTGAAEKIATYAAESPALQRAVLVLYQSALETSVPMSPVAMKAMHFTAGASIRGRTVQGKARRQPETP